MQKQNIEYIKYFFGIDFLLHNIIIVGVAFILYEANKYMSFAGFASLFVLILLIPYVIVLIHILVLLLLSMILKKTILVVIAMILQIICSLLCIGILYLFQSAISWFELVVILQIIVAIVILCLLLENRNI
ncbi:hypothetical protein [Clostridium sp. MD294]|uniref:hypothetical protein n=1 Tax=Clostridium sp. MD294 TaxID=97138 RepID=UPI0002CC1D03|nr:hypothetical protein [Clostridium sp. MD294]NDO46347.1 hypothetical protein [Clostridium sp. MD294]USF29226.1 hypothetical protein C820_000611 [Clostridium sp. MD294]